MTPSTTPPPASSPLALRTLAHGVFSSVLVPTLLFSGFFLALGWVLKSKPDTLALVNALLASPDMSAVALMALGVYVLGVLIVGTFSTAHNGEMLGTQWSSLWLPVRITALAALFLPVVQTAHGPISLLADAGLWLLQLAA